MCDGEKMISVIIPTYNRADRIEKSIRSVLNQSYKDIELLVIDDGSTDNTYEVVSKIKDDRLFYYKQENQGACAARNHGMNLAKGKYIAFQDSDDIWYADKLEKQYNFIEMTKADLVYCGMHRIVHGKKMYIPENQDSHEKVTTSLLLYHNKISTQTILMKREIAEKISFDTTFKRLQDWDFVLQVSLAGFSIEYFPKALVRSEVQQDSITSSISSEKAYLHLIEKYSELYQCDKKALAHIFSIISFRYKHLDKRKKRKYLKLSYKTYPNAKTFIKIFLDYLGIY